MTHSTFSQTGRNISIPAVTEAHIGTYTVTIAISGGCSHTATTAVTLANCDLYIQGYDAAQTETFELKRIGAATTNATYEPITLKLLPFEQVPGVENLFAAYNITWLYNGNPIPGANNKAEYTANKPGRYTANLSLKLNPATTCTAEAHLNAIPCKSFDDLACGTPVSVTLPNTQVAGVALAPGDKFTAGDYTVVITEIISGDPGYIGTGYVEMRLVAGIVAKKIAVDFTNLVVNDCYEMAGGSVITQYDPNWGGVLDIDELINDVDDPIENLGKEFDVIEKLLSDLKDEMLTFPSTCSQKDRITKLINELEIAKNLILINSEYSNTEKSQLTSPLISIINNVREQLNCIVCDPSGRVSSNSITNCISPEVLSEQINSNISSFLSTSEIVSENIPSEVEFGDYLILPNGSIEFYLKGATNARIGVVPTFIILANTRDLAMFGLEYLYYKEKGYSDNKATLYAGWNVFRNQIHVLLDGAAFVPVYGELADGLNAIIYVFEGDYVNASFSAVSMIPFGGDIGAKGTKYTKALVEAGKTVVGPKTFYLAKRALERVNAAKASYGNQIADVLAESFNWKAYRAKVASIAAAKGYLKWQGHHILPRELIESSDVLRKAIQQGFDFNDVKNLIPLPLTRHSGSHPAYTTAIFELIDELKSLPKYAGKEKQLIEDVLSSVKKTIERSNKRINEITVFIQ